MTVTKTLTFMKSTAGTHVFGEPRGNPDSIFPALYLPKSLFPNGPTNTVTVTLEVPA
jgi:hypothetical protein